MEKHELEEILKKYHAGQCTEDERVRVEYYMLNNTGASLSDPELEESSNSLIASLKKEASLSKSINWPLRILSTAAAIALLVGIWTIFSVKEQIGKNAANDIDPGSNQATLTLPNGKVIQLSEMKDGELATDRNVKIIKKADGQLLYQFNPGVKLSPTRDSIPSLVSVNEIPQNPLRGLNAVKTPRGGQYHIALPDGTNVWINAGSTLCFPSTFEGLAERRVLLIGEAYFEVAQVKTLTGMKKRARKMPFIVKTAKQEVMVLGTHFNINCYPDEPDTKTTLLEGSVGITAPLLQAEQTILKPDDQAINDGSVIRVKKVDTELAVAWMKGEFMFKDDNLESIMRKVARWYNVEVVYEHNEARKEMFGGGVSRYDKISKVLSALEGASDLKFKVIGRKVIVTK